MGALRFAFQNYKEETQKYVINYKAVTHQNGHVSFLKEDKQEG
jgi:hypothetical protein